MKKTAKNLYELIGETPLLELKGFAKNHAINSKVYGKLEYLNPTGSIKDRIALSMILDKEIKGEINSDTVIIEPTSGNTGIGLASICAAKGLRIMLVMPENMSVERMKLLKAYGAELVLTDAALGMKGAIDKANELNASIKNSVILSQFENPNNPLIHKKTTAVEIWRDTKGEVEIFVAGIGTGGTITGAGEFLKRKNKTIKVIGVEPLGSPILTEKRAGSHKIQGIGAGFIPKILNLGVVDEVIAVSDADAIKAAKEVAKLDGVMVGISSGAAIVATKIVMQRPENKNKMCVTILPDTGERYISTDLFE